MGENSLPDSSDDGGRKSSVATAIVIHPDVVQHVRSSATGGSRPRRERLVEDRLTEACGLARAIDLHIADARVVSLKETRPSTLFGKGKTEELGALIRQTGAELAIVDAALSPGQQRNLERAWEAKVLDRTALILEIFGDRAHTREGRLQVDLAHLTYQRTRLVRSWTHLERQRGGVGFLGGPGETQIEADRRILADKITKLRRELESVKRTRHLHRSARKKVPYPIVALIGYTNAGKSTLFNSLTQSDVVAEDMLFATLDPTMRAVSLPSGQHIILADTVGFISDLPTELVAAFRATLEEVLEADILVHVRDISHPDTEHQRLDVLQVLKALDVDEEDERPVIELCNKIDLLPDSEQFRLDNVLERVNGYGVLGEEVGEGARAQDQRLMISAATGQGLDRFLAVLDELLLTEAQTIDVVLAPEDGGAAAWLYRNGNVINRVDTEEGDTHLRIQLSTRDIGRFEKEFGRSYQTSLL